eukprot:4348599-Prymnesium_polylepis.1
MQPYARSAPRISAGRHPLLHSRNALPRLALTPAAPPAHPAASSLPPLLRPRAHAGTLRAP